MTRPVLFSLRPPRPLRWISRCSSPISRATIPAMRPALAYATLALAACASVGGRSTRPPTLTPQQSGTTTLLIAVSAVNDDVAWVAGANRTFLRTTNGGATWTAGQVGLVGPPTLQFRD